MLSLFDKILCTAIVGVFAYRLMLAGAAESDKSLMAADLVQNLTERIQALETYVLAQQETYPICDAEGRTVRLEVPETSG